MIWRHPTFLWPGSLTRVRTARGLSRRNSILELRSSGYQDSASNFRACFWTHTSLCLFQSWFFWVSALLSRSFPGGVSFQLHIPALKGGTPPSSTHVYGGTQWSFVSRFWNFQRCQLQTESRSRHWCTSPLYLRISILLFPLSASCLSFNTFFLSRVASHQTYSFCLIAGT